MNLILGYFIIVLVLFFVGATTLTTSVSSVLSDSPASRAGILTGDKIIMVNGHVVEDVSQDFMTVVHRSLGERISITLDRQGENVAVQLVPEALSDSDRGLIGVELKLVNERYRFFPSLFKGFFVSADYVNMVFKSLVMLGKGDVSFSDMAGPIGIVQYASFEFSRGFFRFFEVMGMISITLGVINLFPFPVLDGGHLVFLLIEGLMGRPIPKRIETVIFRVGIILLLSLMVLVVFNDVFQWQSRLDFFRNLPGAP